MATFVAGGTGSGDLDAGFAKLQGEDFEYYMQTYSIILGRSSKKAAVDVDLASIGGGMSISRHHARIFYDFSRRRFALEVIGKNGCLVEGVHHVPGNPPVKLDSQDLLQIGDKKFYFLLPVRSIFASVSRHHLVPAIPPPFSGMGHDSWPSDYDHDVYDDDDDDDDDDDGDNDDDDESADEYEDEDDNVGDDVGHVVAGGSGMKLRMDLGIALPGPSI